MKDSVYLVMNRRGVTEMRKRKPQLSSDEVAVRINVEISDHFFRRFIPDANLTIPDSYVMEPEIDVEVGDPPAPAPVDGDDDDDLPPHSPDLLEVVEKGGPVGGGRLEH